MIVFHHPFSCGYTCTVSISLECVCEGVLSPSHPDRKLIHHRKETLSRRSPTPSNHKTGIPSSSSEVSLSSTHQTPNGLSRAYSCQANESITDNTENINVPGLYQVLQVYTHTRHILTHTHTHFAGLPSGSSSVPSSHSHNPAPSRETERKLPTRCISHAPKHDFMFICNSHSLMDFNVLKCELDS